MIIQTESAFFSQDGSAFVVILEWFIPYLWAFETKLTAWRTVYGKPQVGPFKYQRTLYGKLHGRVKHVTWNSLSGSDWWIDWRAWALSYIYHHIIASSTQLSLFGPELRDVHYHHLLKWGWNGSCEKDVGGITGTGLYVCFSVFTIKQRLWGLVVQIYFPNSQVTSTVYFKKRCLHSVLRHIASNVTIKRILILLSVPNYSLTPTVSFISGLTNFPVH
jgi:hypothetical protein